MKQRFEEFEEIISKKKTLNETKIKEKIVLTAKELLEIDTDANWLWEKYIPKGVCIGLVGSSDSKKSTLARQLAIFIAKNDNNLLGQELKANFGKVLIVVTEEPKEFVASSLKSQIQDEDKAAEIMENIKFAFINDPESAHELIWSLVNETNYDLVVIDVWMDLFVGSANSVNDVRKDLNKYSEYCSQSGCSFLFIHHINKAAAKSDPNKNNVNGSHGIEARMRAVLELRTTHDNISQVSILKSNYYYAPDKYEPTFLEFNHHTRMFSVSERELEKLSGKIKYDNKEVGNRILTLHKKGMSIRKTREALLTEFSSEKVPSETWLKNFIHESKIKEIQEEMNGEEIDEAEEFDEKE